MAETMNSLFLECSSGVFLKAWVYSINPADSDPGIQGVNMTNVNNPQFRNLVDHIEALI